MRLVIKNQVISQNDNGYLAKITQMITCSSIDLTPSVAPGLNQLARSL
jgi:hypothetical protein